MKITQLRRGLSKYGSWGVLAFEHTEFAGMRRTPARGRHQVAFNRAEARGCPKSNHFLFSAHIYEAGWNLSPTQGARSVRPD